MQSKRSHAALAAAGILAWCMPHAFAGGPAVAGPRAATVPLASSAATTAPLPWHALSLTTIDGQPAGLPAVQDSPVLLQFWASWCQSCGGLMWELDRLSGAHPQVPYLAISIDAEPEEAARIGAHPLHARHPARYLHDATGALARRLDIQVVPAIVLLDASGRERLRHVGHVNSGDLQRMRAALAELVPPPATPHGTTP